MDGQNVRLAASAVAAVAAIAVVLRQSGYVVKGPWSGAASTATSTLSRHVVSESLKQRGAAPVVAEHLSLQQRLDLRALQSLTYLLGAFGPRGFNAKDCAAGTMIASPSRPQDREEDENENYYFQWPRDGALCLREVVRRFILAQNGSLIGVHGERSKELEVIIRDFITMNAKLQHTANPSGAFETGGLGEPKFNVDGSPFEADWGRPQNDGPALRAVSLLNYANYLVNTKDPAALQYVISVLFRPSAAHSPTIIKDDLDYVARKWKDSTFELWEEVNADSAEGGHFHMLMVQRRALLAGANFAVRPEIKDAWSAGRYRAEANAISEHLEKFWNVEGKLGLEGGPDINDPPMAIDWNDARNLGKIPKALLHQPHIVGTLARLNGQQKPCQVDTAVLLGITHGYDGDVTGEASAKGPKPDPWLPWGERSLATLDRLVDVFGIVYPINAGRSGATGILCGRYPEDVYDGIVQSIGHPWFLCTHGVAEVLAITARHFAALPSEPIVVTEATASFWTKASSAGAAATEKGASSVGIGTYARAHPDTGKTYEALLTGLQRMVDGYLGVCDEFVGRHDRMSEQIERRRGAMRGARELSWSYASFLSAMAARNGDFVRI